MTTEERHTTRFKDVGRVEAPELCSLAGTIEDISKNGCRIHYTFPVDVDMENDYSIKITFARIASEGVFALICHPIWTKEYEGCTDIGVEFLPSADFVKLSNYVEQLNKESYEEDIDNQISGPLCQII